MLIVSQGDIMQPFKKDYSDINIHIQKQVPVTLDIESNKTESTVIKGYASTFGNMDYHKDVFVRGAFANTLKESQGVWPVLLNHKDQIGMNTLAKETSKGLYIESDLYDDEEGTEKAKEAVALVKKSKKYGHQMGLSIGGIIKNMAVGYDDEKGMYWEIKKFIIMEHSVTPTPANPQARIKTQKNLLDFFNSKESNNDLKFIAAYLDKSLADIQVLHSIHKSN